MSPHLFVIFADFFIIEPMTHVTISLIIFWSAMTVIPQMTKISSIMWCSESLIILALKTEQQLVRVLHFWFRMKMKKMKEWGNLESVGNTCKRHEKSCMQVIFYVWWVTNSSTMLSACWDFHKNQHPLQQRKWRNKSTNIRDSCNWDIIFCPHLFSSWINTTSSMMLLKLKVSITFIQAS